MRNGLEAPVALLLAALLLASGACVGPARTQESYREKAANSAEAMLSNVETAQLVTELSLGGNTFSRYLSLVLSESEVAADAIADAFATVQPPGGDDMDALRSDLNALLSEATTVLGELRVAAYRGDERALRAAAEVLPDIRRRLRSFVELEET